MLEVLADLTIETQAVTRRTLSLNLNQRVIRS